MNAMSHASIRAAAHGLIRLRRDGAAPLRFDGRLIGRHDGCVPGAALWHDLALYRTAGGGYAAAILAVLRTQGCNPPHAVACHAALADTLDQALTWLETHDAAADICPGLSAPALSVDDPHLPPAALMLQAAALYCACQDVVRRYRIGVGAFLSSLGRLEI